MSAGQQAQKLDQHQLAQCMQMRRLFPLDSVYGAVCGDMFEYGRNLTDAQRARLTVTGWIVEEWEPAPAKGGK